jgi:hypothetical protein
MSKWEKFRNLSLSELWLLCKAFFLLPITALGLRLMGFNAVRSALSYGLPAAGYSTDARSVDRAQKIAKMVQVAAVYGRFGATCLPRSMVLWRFLQRHGIGCDLRLGARSENGNFEAHAWVEVDGVALNETADVGERFGPLAPEANELGIRNAECGKLKQRLEDGGMKTEGEKMRR